MPTAGEILPDGTILELVRLRDELRLHVWRNGQSRTVACYENAGITYVPITLDSADLSAIRFPQGAIGYGSTGQLFRAILDVLEKFSGIANEDLTPAAYWLLSSWFQELLPVAPTLIVVGPSPADVRKFFRLLRCLCRRGVALTELNPGGFLAIPMFLRPTLLVEQSRLDRQTRGLLRAAASRNYIPRRGTFLDLRCARAVSCDQDDLDGDLRESCLTISLFPLAAGVPAFDASNEEKLAAQFQPRLLRFRCKNFRKVAESTFDAPAFTTGMRDLARSLGAPVVGDATLEASNVISRCCPPKMPTTERRSPGVRTSRSL